MTAPVVNLAAYRLKQDAIRRGERVRDLVETLLAVRGYDGATTEEARHAVCAFWQQQGHANQGEVKEALRTVEEMTR